MMPATGSAAGGPVMLAPPLPPGQMLAGPLPSALPRWRGGSKSSASRSSFLRPLERQLLDLGRVVDDVRFLAALEVVRLRLGRVRLHLRQLLARHLRLRRRPHFHRPDRFAGVAVVGVDVGLLGDLEQARDAPAADVDVEQDRRRRRVVVPDVVLDQLLVPDPLAGLHVQRDDAGAEQVVAGAEAAVVVDGRAVGRDVDQAARRVGRHRRPRRHVAGPAPRVVLPGLVAELARPRDHVELPHELPGLDVVGRGCRRARSRPASGCSPARPSCRRSARR